MDEAFDSLQAGGVQVDLLRVRAFPFSAAVEAFIAAHDTVFVVEQNRDAQLRSMIVNECGVDPVRLVPILHYDGTPITARFIARAIGDHLDTLKVTPLRKLVS
jgi:2-oxoglutarate ferredoxin oxidoreductase subunit alpha